jgi:hypothetical protein
MKIDRVVELVPLALRELHEAGYEQVYINQLGRRVMQHDPEFMERRQRWNERLGRIGIHRNELPDGFKHPRPYIMSGALNILVGQGIVERVPDPDAPSPLRVRTMYALANFEPAAIPQAPVPEAAQ